MFKTATILTLACLFLIGSSPSHPIVADQNHPPDHSSIGAVSRTAIERLKQAARHIAQAHGLDTDPAPTRSPSNLVELRDTNGSIVAIVRLIYIGDMLLSASDSQGAGIESIRNSFEWRLGNLGFTPFDGRTIRVGGETVYYRAFRDTAGAAVPNPTQSDRVLAASILSLSDYPFALLVHGLQSKPPQSAPTPQSGESLPERLMLALLEDGSFLSQDSPRPNAPQQDTIGRIASASVSLSDNRVRIALLDRTNRPVVWRAEPIEIRILDQANQVRSRITIYDSKTLSILGEGIELPNGAKRLELRSSLGNLFPVELSSNDP